MTDEQKIATISSQGAPLAGQINRSSQNFSFGIPPGTTQLRYKVTSTNAATLIFNVMKDVTLGIDPVVARDASNGSVSPPSAYQSGTNYYIASPRNNPGNPPPAFVVELWAIW